MMPLTLPEALRIVADVHTEADREVGFVVQMGARPRPWDYRSERYVEAWGVIRHEAFRRPYWWRRLIWRVRNWIGGRP
jgi:hypothetical protein